MTNYPNALDDDTSLTPINDNLLANGADAINDVRDAISALEQVIGSGPTLASATVSLADRLLVLVDTGGHINSSLIMGLGLVTTPIYDNQIAPAAGIEESKLSLNYPTLDLFNYIRDLSRDVNLSLGWISATGVKLDPHLIGLIYRHDLLQIDVIDNSALYLNNVFRVNRDNSNAYTLLSDMNSELLSHQWSDGTIITAVKHIVTNSGGTYPSNFAHTASGLYVDTSGFAVIPQTDNSVQAAFDYIDSNSIFLFGTRIQNLYHNGISLNSRSSSLSSDGYGQPLVSWTPAIAFLRGQENQTTPIDDPAIGDDIIQFMPPSSATSNFSFDEQFLQTRVGDIIRVNYAADGYNVIIQSVISEIKYEPGTPSIYMVRIAGKNIAYSPNAIARIDRTLFNNNKYGVLASANVSTTGIMSIGSVPVMPSLIVGSPRGAQCLGVGFKPEDFNEDMFAFGGSHGHFMLYLVLYPDGNPLHGAVQLQGIDVTGNGGITPGAYTLDSIVSATNDAFRKPGYNYRFIAFQYNGEFGIMFADSYNNASFSIISADITSGGAYDQSATETNYPNNVVDVFTGYDALGLGPTGANVASVPFSSSFTTSNAAQYVTRIFAPLRRNNYYVNGAELERMGTDVNQMLDGYGDGYWLATIDGYTASSDHMNVTYQVLQDLSASGLKPGKTLVAQPLVGGSGGVDYGRFIIKDVVFSLCGTSTPRTLITVYDAVHNTALSPYTTAGIGTQVALYFGTDSVSFNTENASDFSISSPSYIFTRFFEAYVDKDEKTFTHERARFSCTGTPTSYTVNGATLYNGSTAIGQINLLAVSPKLRGYQNVTVTKITLNLLTYDTTSGVYDGYLCNTLNGTNFTNCGPLVSGKVGTVTRFYDESNIDYIDIRFPVDAGLSAFATYQFFDIQLFPTLELDEDVMLISSCQMANSAQTVNQLEDERQFGNISEEELSTSAKAYIATPERLLHFNGVIRGFDISSVSSPDQNFVSINGGLALVNGNIIAVNEQTITIPKIQEYYSIAPFTNPPYPMIFALCVNDESELVLIPITGDNFPHMPPGDRIMTVINNVTGNKYQVDCDNFSNILNNRKDLTALYLLISTVTGTGASATISSLSQTDIRRYANDADSNICAVLTDGNAQGNFRNLDAALVWLLLNGSYQNQLQVKGSFTATSQSRFTNVQVVGASADATLNFATSALFITGSTFSNLTINVSKYLNLNTGIGTVTGPVVFNNCTINVIGTANAFVIGSEVTFNGCTFNYNYDATLSGAYYLATDWVNAGYGMIYANIGVAGSLQNLNVTGCSFTNAYPDHFSFVSLQFSDYAAIATNINISNNTFTNETNSISGAEDIRAVIALTSISPVGTAYPLYPRVINLTIEHNVCNQDQMIVVTGTPNYNTHYMTDASLTVINSSISNNVCGTIGYFVAYNDVANFNNSAGALAVRDKGARLVISDNTCHLIINLNNVGTLMPFLFGSTQTVTVPTGYVDITGNAANWICVGAYNDGTSGQGVRISNNRLSPSASGYLANYTNIVLGASISDCGITLFPDSTTVGKSQSIISENILAQSSLINSNGSIAGPYYYGTGISTSNNARILNNIVDGVVFTAAISMGYNNSSAVIIGNELNRSSKNITAYILRDFTSTNGQIIITGNTFDSTTVDGHTTTNQIANALDSDVIFENVNQNINNLIDNPIQFSAATSSPGLSQTATTGATQTMVIAAQTTSGSFHGGNITIASGVGGYRGGDPGNVDICAGTTYAAHITGGALGTITFYENGPRGSPTAIGGSILQLNNWWGTNNGQIGLHAIYGYWVHTTVGGEDVIISTMPFYFPDSSMTFMEIEWVKRSPSMSAPLSNKASMLFMCDSGGLFPVRPTPVNAYPPGIIYDDVATAFAISYAPNSVTIKAVHDNTYEYYWQIIVRINQA